MVTLQNAFPFTVSDEVPDNTNVRFYVTCTDGTDVWESHFNARIYAPEFELVSAVLETSTGGSLNPGDNGTVHFTLKNKGGADAPSTFFRRYNSHDIITIPTTEWNLESLAAGQEVTVDMAFTLGDAAQIGTLYQLFYQANYGNYSLNGEFFIPVGQSTEGFETGDFSAFNWQSTSPIYAWEVVTQNPYEGMYCARSSAINDYETTALFIRVEVGTESTMSFYYKVSSESNYDKLYFLIDGVEKNNWSGEVDWTLASYILTPGTHELRWEYRKDVSVSSGSDCAWIDNVSFPASTVITEITEEASHTAAIYPNPNNGSFTIELGEETSTVIVYNSLGQAVYQENGAIGTKVMNLNLTAGIYFVNVKSDKSSSIHRIIVK